MIVDVARKLTRETEVGRLAAARRDDGAARDRGDPRAPRPLPGSPSSSAPSGSSRTAPSRTPWIPFGGGVRRCIGASFAQVEMRVVLREVLRRVRLRADSARPERPQVRHVTVVPARGCRVVVEERLRLERRARASARLSRRDRGRSGHGPARVDPVGDRAAALAQRDHVRARERPAAVEAAEDVVGAGVVAVAEGPLDARAGRGDPRSRGEADTFAEAPSWRTRPSRTPAARPARTPSARPWLRPSTRPSLSPAAWPAAKPSSGAPSPGALARPSANRPPATATQASPTAILPSTRGG